MDETDRKILEILEEDGRASYTDIAEQLGVSEGTVRNRVDRMIEDEEIEKFTVETSRKGAKAILMADLSTEKDIELILEEFPVDMEVNEVAGDYDLIIEFSRDNTEKLNQQIDQIRQIEGVIDTRTYTVLKTRSL